MGDVEDGWRGGWVTWRMGGRYRGVVSTHVTGSAQLVSTQSDGTVDLLYNPHPLSP